MHLRSGLPPRCEKPLVLQTPVDAAPTEEGEDQAVDAARRFQERRAVLLSAAMVARVEETYGGRRCSDGRAKTSAEQQVEASIGQLKPSSPVTEPAPGDRVQPDVAQPHEKNRAAEWTARSALVSEQAVVHQLAEHSAG